MCFLSRLLYSSKEVVATLSEPSAVCGLGIGSVCQAQYVLSASKLDSVMARALHGPKVVQ